jgi:hypothetical protein
VTAWAAATGDLCDQLFCPKDDILNTVIQLRLANTEKMLDRWAAEGVGPIDRIQSFVQMLIANRAVIKRYGCPVGILYSQADVRLKFLLG